MSDFNRHLACWTLALVASGALAQDPLVSVSEEPHHRLMLESARYRIYDVLIDAGTSTLLHHHDANNFVVLLSDAQVTTEMPGRPTTTGQAKAGVVLYSPASTAAPLTHKITASGSTAFRNFLIELRLPAPDTAASTETGAAPAWTVARESPRGRAYRSMLAAGQALEIPAGAVEPILVCLTEGDLRHSALVPTAAHWHCKTGDFLVLKGGNGAPVVTNDGQAGLDVVLVAPR